MWNIDSWSWVVCPILRVSAGLLNDRSVDDSSQVIPELVANQTGESVDWILVDARFVKEDVALTILLGKIQLLEEVR